MQVHVQIAGNAKTTHVAVNGEGFHVDASALITDPRFVSMIWDGRDGEIRRTSSVPGKFDVEHFADEARVLPFLPPWQAAKTAHEERLAEAERVRQEQDAERRRQHAEAEDAARKATEERTAIAARVAALKAGEIPENESPPEARTDVTITSRAPSSETVPNNQDLTIPGGPAHAR
ncbi:hypothetical protein [Rhodoplanes sp. SY1]|uniref:hypothetical protein n=1 Tax=Rhodoplanes sp. SY1 TaxID=3166646 RepID=UPI0038B4974F